MTPETCADIHKACFTTPRPWTAAEFTDFLSSPNCFFCTEENGFALGRIAGPEAELLTLAVVPDAQGKGIGRRLLVDFEDQARSLGAEELFLEVSTTNAAAVHLYETAGYEKSGLRKNYYESPNGPRISAALYRKSVT